jgi:SAM-dependent methyltransferase
MVAILGYSRAQIFRAVQGMYTLVADRPESRFHFPTGATAARRVGYPALELEKVPAPLLDSFAGVGYPFHGDAISGGDTVLDVGAGAGSDTILAADRAGAEGYVIALDLTAAMTRKLRDAEAGRERRNIGVIQASAENLPLRDASVDSVTSNGSLNLVPDKRRAIGELFRVLRPSGRLQIADVVINRPVVVDCDSDPRLWVECVVGATVEDNLLALFRDAGFESIHVVRRFDYFAHSPSPQTREIAASFGAHTVELAMRRGPRKPSPARQLLRRGNPLRVARHLWRHGFTAAVALGLAAASCYGAMAAVALAALFGLALPLDAGLWSATILGFSALTFIALAAGAPRHGDWRPLLTAGAGLAVLAYTLLLDYHMLTELAGFLALAAASLWDRRLRRRSEARTLGLGPPGRR